MAVQPTMIGTIIRISFWKSSYFSQTCFPQRLVIDLKWFIIEKVAGVWDVDNGWTLKPYLVKKLASDMCFVDMHQEFVKIQISFLNKETDAVVEWAVRGVIY